MMWQALEKSIKSQRLQFYIYIYIEREREREREREINMSYVGIFF